MSAYERVDDDHGGATIGADKSDFIGDLRKGISKASKNGTLIRVLCDQKTHLPSKLSLKTRNKVNFRFMVIDKKQVFLLPVVEASPDNEFGVWVKNEHFAQNFETLFDGMWKSA